MNLKKYYKSLLSGSSKLIALIGENKITSTYPQDEKNFPLVAFEDMNSADVAFSDNKPEGTSAQVRIHVFSKTESGYPKAEDIAEVVRSVFREDYWAMINNTETTDVSDNIKHRVLDFRREFYSL
jgi:hypothetical protein